MSSISTSDFVLQVVPVPVPVPVPLKFSLSAPFPVPAPARISGSFSVLARESVSRRRSLSRALLRLRSLVAAGRSRSAASGRLLVHGGDAKARGAEAAPMPAACDSATRSTMRLRSVQWQCKTENGQQMTTKLERKRGTSASDTRPSLRRCSVQPPSAPSFTSTTRQATDDTRDEPRAANARCSRSHASADNRPRGLLRGRSRPGRRGPGPARCAPPAGDGRPAGDAATQ